MSTLRVCVVPYLQVCILLFLLTGEIQLLAINTFSAISSAITLAADNADRRQRAQQAAKRQSCVQLFDFK